MATKASTDVTPKSTDHVRMVRWSNLTNAPDDGEAVELAGYADRSVQVQGIFDTTTVVIEGSNDGVNYHTLTDPQGTALSFTAAGLRAILQIARYVRPRVTAGGAGTDITVTMFMRGVKP
jgi:hypothetical protein